MSRVSRGEVCRGVVGAAGRRAVAARSCVGFRLALLVVDTGCRRGVAAVLHFRAGGVAVARDASSWRLGGVNDGHELLIAHADDHVAESGVDVKIFGLRAVTVRELQALDTVVFVNEVQPARIPLPHN